MRLDVEVAGVRFGLDPAAVSAIRYRAEYGESAAEAGTDEKKLLRLFHIMIPPGERPTLEELAGLARRDGGFAVKALRAADALLAPDPLRPEPEAGEREAFDEYQVLALLAVAGVDYGLACELPILHLASVAARCFALKGGDREDYHEFSAGELAELYPR